MDNSSTLHLRPADAGETETVPEIAVTTSATVLVTISVFLRYLGRWVLKKRVQAEREGGGDLVYGLDDGKFDPFRGALLICALTHTQFLT